MPKILSLKHVAAAVVAATLFAGVAHAADTTAWEPKKESWSFSSPIGTYDRAALQRGFQVYKEVCSACHALKHIAFRNLGERGGPGFTAAEVQALAAAYKVPAGPNEQGQTVDSDGQPLMRQATPADIIPGPFANDKAARAANNGALPPDLSMVVKARENGSNYVYSILTGFSMKPPADEKISETLHYNPYFAGHQIAMAQPLQNDSVTYADGTKATIAQEAHDVVTFLTWASDPKMEERKQTGTGVMIFLIGFALLAFLSYRKVWHGAH
jgi:cytochrome c1